ncbi:galectin 17 [Sphaeramia orbicularis]|uniref:Uncharacterized LOC115427904 n=1 Tax=Sphaeramia orbicularis TaxID=375764 RepID=A0A672YRL3_9TELE|nr:uncharacterized protein LOC115427904 [Sphaeramia orbicularis]
MDTRTTPHRGFLLHFHLFLFVGLVDSSPLLSITSKVGLQAKLPCSWKSRLDEAPPVCHVQWRSTADTVFEQQGALRWEAAELAGRAEVPEGPLGSGDCSLIIKDVQIADAGRYESYMVVDGAQSRKTRVFIQSVKLLVYDHKLFASKHPGEDLVLNLHTPHSMRVVYQGRNSSDWSTLWIRGDAADQRLQKHPLKEELTVKGLKRGDEGTYKVLDENGLAISAVELSVEDRSTALKFTQSVENENLTGDAGRSCGCSVLVLLSFVVSIFQILHLL